MINPFKILGVHPAMSLTEIRNAYKTYMKHCHPDCGGVYAEALEGIEAYKILTNIPALKEHLALCKVLGVACPECKGRGYTFKQKGLTDRINKQCGICGGQGYLTKEK